MNGEDERDLHEVARFMARCDEAKNQWILDQMKAEIQPIVDFCDIPDEQSKGAIMTNEDNTEASDDIYAIGVDGSASLWTHRIVTAYLAGISDGSSKRVVTLDERTSLMDPLFGRYNITYVTNHKIGRDEFKAICWMIPDKDERAKVVRIKLMRTMVPKYVAMVMGDMDKE